MNMPGDFAKKSCSGCGNSRCKDHTPPSQNSKDPTLLPLPEVKRNTTVAKSVNTAGKEKANHTKKNSYAFSNMKFKYLSTFSNTVISRVSSSCPDLGGYGTLIKSLFAGGAYYLGNSWIENNLYKTKGEKEIKKDVVEIDGMTTTMVMTAQWCLLVNILPELSNIPYRYQLMTLLGIGPLMHWVINDWVNHKVRRDRSSLGVNIFDVGVASVLVTKLLGMLSILGIKTEDIGMTHEMAASFLAKCLVDQAGNELVKFDKNIVSPVFSGISEKCYSGLKKSYREVSNGLWKSEGTRLEQIASRSSQTYGKILVKLEKSSEIMKQGAVRISKPIWGVLSKGANNPVSSKEVSKPNKGAVLQHSAKKRSAGNHYGVRHKSPQ